MNSFDAPRSIFGASDCVCDCLGTVVEYVFAGRVVASIGRTAVQRTPKYRRGRHAVSALRERDVEVTLRAVIVAVDVKISQCKCRFRAINTRRLTTVSELLLGTEWRTECRTGSSRIWAKHENHVVAE